MTDEPTLKPGQHVIVEIQGTVADVVPQVGLRVVTQSGVVVYVPQDGAESIKVVGGGR